MDCQEPPEVHRNVIDVKSIVFLMILLTPVVSFVTLHMTYCDGIKDAGPNSINKKAFIVAKTYHVD